MRIIPVANAAKVAINPGGSGLEDVAFNILTKVVIPTVSALAVGAIIYAGVLYLTSQGDPERLKKAKTALLWPIIGIVLIVLSISIVVVLQSVIKTNI